MMVQASIGPGTRRFHQRLFDEYLRTGLRDEGKARDVVRMLGAAGFCGPYAARAAWGAHRYRPQLEGNCLLVFETDSAVTRTGGSNVVSEDLSTWNLSQTTRTTGHSDPDGGTSAVRIISDTSTQDHSLITVHSGVSGGPWGIVQFRAKYENTRYACCRFSTTSGVIFDVQNGAVTSNIGSAQGSISALSGGWYLCTARNVSVLATSLIIGMAPTPTLGNWTGTGADTMLLYKGSLTQEVATGFVNSVSNVTWSPSATNTRPGYSADVLNSKAAVGFFGSHNFLSTESAIVSAMANASAITLCYVASAGTSRDQDGTVFAAGNSGQSSAGSRRFGYTSTGTGGYRATCVDDAAATVFSEVTSGVDNAWHVFTWFSSSTVSLDVDGTALISSAALTYGALTPNRLAFGCRGSSSLSGSALANGAAVRALYLFSGDMGLGSAAAVRLRTYAASY